MKKALSFGMALAMVFSFSACAGETEAAAGNESVGIGATYTLAQDPSEYNMFCYWPAPDTFFDSYCLKGIEAFEADYGIDVEWMVGTDWTQDVENQSVEAMAADGYDLFMILSADSTGANALYQELRDFGAHVVNYCNKVDEPVQCEAVLSSDNSVNAYASAKYLIDELMGGKGKIIQVLENLNDVNTQVRQEAVEKAVAEYPDVEICQTVADITTVDEGYEKVSDAIASNPDADAIICCAGTASKGIANALADYYGSNPDAKHLLVGTMDQAEEVLAGIRSGQIDYTVAQNGWAMGYVSALALAMMDDGYVPAEDGEFIDTGYIFIDNTNVDTWEADIEAAAIEMVDALQTKWMVKE